MKKFTILTYFTLLACLPGLKAQIITTVAGNGYEAGNSLGGYTGDGGPATAAEMYAPYDLAFDTPGNMYIADGLNNVIREVNTSGTITTFAGNSTAGYTGDGGQATDAELTIPYGVLVDAGGNVFIADTYNNVVRKVNTSGIISTVAGNGTWGYAGDGGQATAAELQNPMGVAVDNKGNLYIADQGNNVVRKVDTLGVITTIAGTGAVGYTGDGGQATAAKMQAPSALAFDGPGDLYISDTFNRVVRKVNTSGIISTVAGKGGVAGYSGDGGPATSAELYAPYGLVLDVNGNLYIADGNTAVREVDHITGIISTFAGIFSQGYSGDGGPATSAQLTNPTDIKFNGVGNFFIADNGNNVIREVGTVPNSTTSVITKNEITVYPNPSNGKFIVSPGHSELVSESYPIVQVYNVRGEEVYKHQLRGNNGQCEIDLSTQPAGIYLYRITNAQGHLLKTDRIVIAR